MISAAQMHMSSWKLNTVNSGVQQYQNAVIEIFHPLHLVATGNPTQFDIYIYILYFMKIKTQPRAEELKGQKQMKDTCRHSKGKGINAVI